MRSKDTFARAPAFRASPTVRGPAEMEATVNRAMLLAARWFEPAWVTAGNGSSSASSGFRPAAEGLRWLCRFLAEQRRKAAATLDRSMDHADDDGVSDDGREKRSTPSSEAPEKCD